MKVLVKQNLVEILEEEGFLDEEKINEIRQEMQISTEDIPESVLLRSSYIDEEDIINALKKHFRRDYVNLKDTKVSPDILKIIPEKTMKENLIASFDLQENELFVATVDPNNLPILDYIEMLTGYDLRVYVTTESSIMKVFDDYYENEGMKNIIDRINIKESFEYPTDLSDEKLAKDKPIVRLVDAILEQAVMKRVSDIHIEPQEKALLVRYRKDGILKTVQYLPPVFHAAIVSRIKIIADLDIAERRLPQDGRFRRRIGRRDLDFRISTITGKYGEKIVIRVLDRTSFAMGFEALGFEPTTQSNVEEIVTSPMGIFLVAGPTGSGKTTTLYSIISYIRSPDKNILTFEDPIEYELLAGSTREGGITQVQIKPKIGFGFADGLRTALRQDPDIIFVGEIRDHETANMAATASLTGHLVLSTLHTLDTVTSITRLFDLGVEPFLLSATLIGILSQRLLRTLCNDCKQKYQIPAKLLKGINHITDEDKITLYRPVGCKTCSKSGYKGRIAIFELLNINADIRQMIYERRSDKEIARIAIEQGLKTMKYAGLEMVYQGKTSIEEVLRVLPKEHFYTMGSRRKI